MRARVSTSILIAISFVMLFVLPSCGLVPSGEKPLDLPTTAEKISIPTDTLPKKSLPNTSEPISDMPIATSRPVANSGNGNYRIDFGSTNGYPGFDWGDFTVWFPWVTIPGNDTLSQKINDNIFSVSTIWVTEPLLNDLRLNEYDFWGTTPTILFHSDRYFSFGMEYGVRKSRSQLYWQATTVDMQTGELVRLDDLIDVNEDFAALLHKGSIVRYVDYVLTPSEDAGQAYRHLAPNILLKYLIECSSDLTEYTSENLTVDDLDKWLARCTFHLESGKLFLSFGYMGIRMIYLDDIEEFLKVPKW